MTNEIKEIIEFLKPIENRTCATLGNTKCKLLLDYITNLQEENERLSKELQQEKKDFKEANDNCFELKHYKSTIDKAIEYIKEHCIDDEFYINLTNKEKHIIDVLSILQGEDDE